MQTTRQLRWPAEGIARVPYWAYSDAEIYAREQARIFGGPSWSYVALEAEIPAAGDYKRTFVGEKPVVVVRDQDGGVNVFENRCAHRGVQFCQRHLGNALEIMCPYHQWTYDLKGNLIGVPFRRGVKKQGGMPADFDPKAHGLRRLEVHVRRGAVFASFAADVEPFEAYLGTSMLALFDRVFDGRELAVLGYSRQLIPANWKLMFENIKDPYHASLLHVFLVSFGLFRADSPSKIQMDATGRHGALISWKGEEKKSADHADMKAFHDGFKLEQPAMLQPVREFSEYTVVMTTLWPNLIIQQQSNTLAMRQLVLRGPSEFELAWTFFGYADDDAAMRERRLRQANLMGPSGFVSADDSEVMKFSQAGVAPYPDEQGVLEMGGRGLAGRAAHRDRSDDPRVLRLLPEGDGALSAAQRYLSMKPGELRLELEELYAAYTGCLDDERFEDWPGFFTDDCVYKIIPRENVERGLPLATWFSEGKGGLTDRVVAIRKTMMYAPRSIRRLVSGIRVVGWQGETLSVKASYLALETLLDEPTRVFNCGEYRDQLIAVGDRLKFREKLCVFDSLLVPNSLIYPL